MEQPKRFGLQPEYEDLLHTSAYCIFIEGVKHFQEPFVGRVVEAVEGLQAENPPILLHSQLLTDVFKRLLKAKVRRSPSFNTGNNPADGGAAGGPGGGGGGVNDGGGDGGGGDGGGDDDAISDEDEGDEDENDDHGDVEGISGDDWDIDYSSSGDDEGDEGGD